MKLAILIPTRGRPDQLAPLVENICETTPRDKFRIVFAVDLDDPESISAVFAIAGRRDPNGITVVMLEGTYPEKVNAAYESSAHAGFVLVAADDVRFHAGWLEAAAEVLEDPEVDVVAPNDMSPRAGMNATFPIVRRSYIEKRGGSIDKPGLIYHEGYAHNFSDTELWEVACTRGVGRYAPACKIEHLHPAWGKAEVDETYERGGLNPAGWQHDEVLFAERRKLWQA